MTREEAKREILFAKREVMADSWIDKAYDVAIKALTAQPAGHWIFIGCGYKCSECGSVYSWWADSQTSNYCPNCGADMREGEADD